MRNNISVNIGKYAVPCPFVSVSEVKGIMLLFDPETNIDRAFPDIALPKLSFKVTVIVDLVVPSAGIGLVAVTVDAVALTAPALVSIKKVIGEPESSGPFHD